MKLHEFIHELDILDIYKNCDDPSSIKCIGYYNRVKSTVAYPIVSITVTSIYNKHTRVILNTEYISTNKPCITLKQLYSDLKDLNKQLLDDKSKCSIFMSTKKSKNSPIAYHTMPSWMPFLDATSGFIYFKFTNMADYIDKD